MENLQEGFRFHPTDAEAITFLLRFIAGEVMNDSGFITTHVDTYNNQLDPWDIYSRGVPCGNDDGEDDCSQYRYFITKLKKKSESRYNRNVGNKGCWKQNISKPVQKNGGQVIGYKKSMSYVNKSYDRQNGHWLMKEYELSSKILDKFNNDRRDYVFCAIKMRTPTKDSKKLVDNASKVCMNILEHQSPMAAESMNLEHQTLVAAKSTNLEHQSSAVVLEALQGGSVLELELLDFDYQYVPADFECLQSITDS